MEKIYKFRPSLHLQDNPPLVRFVFPCGIISDEQIEEEAREIVDFISECFPYATWEKVKEIVVHEHKKDTRVTRKGERH